MRTRIHAALAAAGLVLALVISGCASDADDSTEVASVNDESQDGDDDSSDEEMSEDELEEAALEFAECMREHGVEMDDPNQGGGLRFKAEPGDLDRGQMEEAMEACEDLRPRGPNLDSEEAREDMLEMAQCMRDNGVEEFPDPQPGEGMHITPDIGEDPDFAEAQETCGDLRGKPGEQEETAS